jgi:hypothetical protein
MRNARHRTIPVRLQVLIQMRRAEARRAVQHGSSAHVRSVRLRPPRSTLGIGAITDLPATRQCWAIDTAG